jgi:hypothetical protein
VCVVESTKAAIAANQIAVTTSEQQLRAYVTARELAVVAHRRPATPGAYIQIEGPVHTYGICAVLRNSGRTPATKVTVNVSCQKLPKPLPRDFAFADSDLFGYGVIGPEGDMFTPIIRINATEFEQIDDVSDWYLWGWVEYDDVLSGTLRHRTEFCFQSDRLRLPTTNEFGYTFRAHSRFNAVEADCMRPIDPHTNRSGAE